LSEEGINRGEREFRAACHLCGFAFHARIAVPDPRQRGCLQLACPRCGLIFDFFAPDEEGTLHRPTEFMEGFRPQGKTSGPLDAWVWVLKSCRYVPDDTQFGRQEVWQRARDTYRRRKGDCEDSAILVADWLGASGYDARVVTGRIRKGGHAWVALRQEGRSYILETTGGRGSFRRVPPRAELMADYLPSVQFDRESVWFRTSGKWAWDYWNDREWARKEQPR
jgi:hypothetical protein